jgi:hypothetical protein
VGLLTEHRVFFTADWGHNLHEPAGHQCFMFLDEMVAAGYSRELFVDDVKVNAWYQFPWLAWTDPDEIAQAVDHLFKQYDVKFLLPATVISSEKMWINISSC